MLPVLAGLDNLDEVEDFLIEASIPIEVNHLFTDDQYVREALIPANAMVIGMRHRKKTLNILAKGSVIMYEETGKEIARFSAPYTFESEAKTKKLAFFPEDSIWLNVHATKTRDFDELQKELYEEEDIDKNACQDYQGNLKETICQEL